MQIVAIIVYLISPAMVIGVLLLLTGVVLSLDRFSSECRKTKTKVNSSGQSQPADANSIMNQSEIESNTCNKRQARENACEQVTIGFGLAADWLRTWRVFCWPITERRKAKPKKAAQLIAVKQRELKQVLDSFVKLSSA